jgi:hypothetical protein
MEGDQFAVDFGFDHLAAAAYNIVLSQIDFSNLGFAGKSAKP